MKVITLIENRPSTSDAGLVAEWGLSLYINTNGHTIIFDTGATGSFAQTAGRLSIDLASIDTVVLSHHHFDHGGGLRRFFQANQDARVYLGRAPTGECFSRVFLFVKKYIGLDKTLVNDYPGRFSTVEEPAEILPGVFVLPHIAGHYSKPSGNARLLVRKDGKLLLDDFSHEMILVIKENDQLVIFTGCAHNGILNMVDTVAQQFKGIPIKAVVGGFHLISMPPFNGIAGSKDAVVNLANQVLDYPIGHTYTGHCTGTKAFSVLKGVMGDRITDLVTGSSFEI